MQLDLSDDDTELLGEVVESAVGQLTSEIAHTDNAGYRRSLKERRLRLRDLLDQLGGAPTEQAV